MKIAKVHNFYQQAGGEDTVFQAECEMLRENGHKVFEYLEFNKKITTLSKAHVALQTIWSDSAYQKMYDFLIDNTPDVVHFHNIFPLLSPSVYYACQELNIPVVQTLDNQRLICPAASFYRNEKLCLDCLGKTLPFPSIVHACYHHSYIHTSIVAAMLTFHKLIGTWQTKVDAFLCSTSFYRDLFIQSGLPQEKIFVMPHFVKPFSSKDFTKPTRDYALFIGRMDPEKGIKTMLAGWQKTNIPLKIRGDGQLEEYAKRLVRQNKMEHVEFIERLPAAQLSNLIRNACFIIVPSEGYYETFGMVIIEAYSMKTPVLVSDIGIASEMVVNQKTGIKFESGNSSDLINKAEWMWEHPVELHRLGENALHFYQEKFTAEKCYKTLISIYENIIYSK